MKIFRSKNETNIVLIFDILTSKNSKNIYSEEKDWLYEFTTEDVINFICNDYYELEVALKDFDLSGISIVILMPFEYNNKSEKSKLNYIEEHKIDLVSFLIELDKEKVILMPFGKMSLYALTGMKDIIRQAGKERNTIIDLKKILGSDIEEKIEVSKKSDLILKYRTIPNYSPSYLFYNKAVVKNFYFIFRQVKSIIDNKTIKEQETKVVREDEVEDFFKDLLSKNLDHIYFDIETESVELSEVLGVSIDYDRNDIPVYIPIYNDVVRTYIRELLRKFPIVGHNLKFDIQQLIYNNIIKYDEYTVKDDTYILGHLIFNKTLGGLSLKHLSRTLIGVVEDWDNSIKEYMRKNKIKSFKHIPVDLLGKYASLDAYYTKQLYNRLIKDYKKEYDFLKNQYREIINLVMNWELRGVKINKEKLQEIEDIIIPEIERAVSDIENLNAVKLYKLQKKKQSFNINSNKQLSELVNKYLKITDIKKKTKSGNVSLDREVLEELEKLYERIYENLSDNDNIREKYVFIKSLNKYKLYTKFRTSYVKPLKEKTDEFDIFRIDYNIGGTVSGRLSSFFHTIPSRGDLGKNFKMLIEARNDDFVIVSIDVSQIEPRVMASLSNDKHLIEAYNTEKDLYKYMASKVFNIPYNEVPKDKRNQMKTLVLAILYGMSATSLAKKLNIKKQEAEEIMRNFFNEFPDVDSWRIDQFIKVKRERKVITPLGREIPVVTEKEEELKRVAVNYVIQSTASEVALISFKNIDNILRKRNMKSFTIGSVHDSLIIETHIDEIFDVIKIVKGYIENTVHKEFGFLKVPLKIDVMLGVSWGNSLELIEMTKNNLILRGNLVDFCFLEEKLKSYSDIMYNIINLGDYIDISELSLLKKYNKLNRSAEIKLEVR